MTDPMLTEWELKDIEQRLIRERAATVLDCNTLVKEVRRLQAVREDALVLLRDAVFHLEPRSTQQTECIEALERFISEQEKPGR